MATMELDTKQSIVDSKPTPDNTTPVTPVTSKSATLDAFMTPTTPKATHTSAGNNNKQQRRRSEVTPPSTPSGARSIEHIQAEHQYLFNNLHRQDARIRSLLGALSAVQAQLQAQENAAKAGQDPLPLTTAEARKLRKSAGFIQSKIAAAERNEQMFIVRIGELVAELQGRQWLAQLQQTRQSRQQTQSGGQNQNWSTPRTVNVPVLDLNLGPSSFSPGLTFSDPHGYFPLQMPQTPYLAQCEVWTPDQVYPHGHPFGQPQGHPLGHHDHPHQSTTTTNIILPPSFVVSPVTPGLHATLSASPVSPPASVTDVPSGSCMSPMSPLAPVFEPGSSFGFGSSSCFPQKGGDGEYGEHGDSAATPIARRPSSSTSAAQAAAFDHVGMHSAAAIDDAAADDDEVESSNENETGDSNVSDTAFLPPEGRPRRVSHSSARPTQVKQKRMSLPPVRFAWPGELIGWT